MTDEEHAGGHFLGNRHLSDGESLEPSRTVECTKVLRSISSPFEKRRMDTDDLVGCACASTVVNGIRGRTAEHRDGRAGQRVHVDERASLADAATRVGPRRAL